MKILGVYYMEFVGIIGASMILFGFYRTSIGRWSGRSYWYEWDNLIGSLLLVAYAFYKESYVTIVLNMVWVITALRGLSSISERKKLSVAKRSKKRK